MTREDTMSDIFIAKGAAWYSTFTFVRAMEDMSLFPFTPEIEHEREEYLSDLPHTD